MAAAKRAANHGARVSIVESERIGGTCVIKGCVPKKLLVYGSKYSKYISEANSYGVEIQQSTVSTSILFSNVRKQVDRLKDIHTKSLTNLGIDIIRGKASFKNSKILKVSDPDTNALIAELSAKHIIVAPGSEPIKGDFDGHELCLVSDDLFQLNSIPESILIVGGGYIACEFSCILNSLGSKVTQLVRGDRILRGFDKEIGSHLIEEMKKKGIQFIFDKTIKRLQSYTNKIECFTDKSESFFVESVLLAIGRKPRISELNLDNAGIECIHNKIKVNSQLQTNVQGIYALGDVSNDHNLTPVAIEEGRVLADNLFASKARLVDYTFISKAVFSQPEIASTGLTEEQAINIHGIENLRIYRSKFRSMSDLIPNNDSQNLLKLIVHKNTEKILGIHMIGENSSEIIQMAAISLKMGATKADFDNTMALHPTIAEEFVTML